MRFPALRLPGLALAAVLALAAAPALAHSTVRQLTPAPGAAVPPPDTVKMAFTFAVRKQECRAALRAPDGREIPLELTPAGADTDLVFLVPADASLTPGTYRVVWHIVSADGHPQEGQYEFTVTAPPTGGAAPAPVTGAYGSAPAGGSAPAAAPESAPATAPEGATAAHRSPWTASVWPWLAVGAALGLGAAAARLARARRR